MKRPASILTSVALILNPLPSSAQIRISAAAIARSIGSNAATTPPRLGSDALLNGALKTDSSPLPLNSARLPAPIPARAAAPAPAERASPPAAKGVPPVLSGKAAQPASSVVPTRSEKAASIVLETVSDWERPRRDVALFVTQTRAAEIHAGDYDAFTGVMASFKSMQQALAREGLRPDEVVRVEIDDLGDLPKKAAALLAPGDRIGTIVLAGHGNSKQFALSRGRAYSGAEAAAELSKPDLLERFLSEITFFFFACNAGSSGKDGFAADFVAALSRDAMIEAGLTAVHFVGHPYFSSPWSLLPSRPLSALSHLIHLTGFYRLFHAVRNRTGEFAFLMQGTPRGALLLAALSLLSIFAVEPVSVSAGAVLPYALLGHLFLTLIIEPLQFMTLRRVSLRRGERTLEDSYGSALSLFRRTKR